MIIPLYPTKQSGPREYIGPEKQGDSREDVSPEKQGGSKLNVSPDLLQAYWAYIRCTGPDFFCIAIHNKETQQIQHGWMPQSDGYTVVDLRRYKEELEELKHLLEQKLETATIKVKRTPDIYEAQDKNLHAYCMYCRCKNGVIGVGWRFEDGSLVKARMMSAFTLYSLGLLCAKEDPILWEVAYRHLPFATGMDRSMADAIIMKHLA